MTESAQFWLVTFTAVTSMAVLLQAGILLGLFLGVRQLQGRIEKLLDNEVQPLLAQAREVLVEGGKTVAKVNLTVDEIAAFTKTQAERLDKVMAEASDRARLQVIRMDDMVSDTLTKVERTSQQVHESVAGPLREVQGVLAGVRSGLEVLLGRRRSRGPVERSPQDEEMFI